MTEPHCFNYTTHHAISVPLLIIASSVFRTDSTPFLSLAPPSGTVSVYPCNMMWYVCLQVDQSTRFTFSLSLTHTTSSYLQPHSGKSVVCVCVCVCARSVGGGGGGRVCVLGGADNKFVYVIIVYFDVEKIWHKNGLLEKGDCPKIRTLYFVLLIRVLFNPLRVWILFGCRLF